MIAQDDWVDPLSRFAPRRRAGEAAPPTPPRRPLALQPPDDPGGCIDIAAIEAIAARQYRQGRCDGLAIMGGFAVIVALLAATAWLIMRLPA